MKNYICPVCGFPDLESPPYDSLGNPSFDICPCCGCEFGYQDATPQAKKSFRLKWIKAGFPWRYPEEKPENWDASSQLRNIGIDINQIDLES